MRNVMIRYRSTGLYWLFAEKVIVKVGAAVVLLFAALGFFAPLLMGQPLMYAAFACAKSTGLALASVGMTIMYVRRGSLQGFVDNVRHYAEARGFMPEVPELANELYLNPDREVSWMRKTAGILWIGFVLLLVLAAGWRNISLAIVIASFFAVMIRGGWLHYLITAPFLLMLAVVGLANPFMVANTNFGEWLWFFPFVAPLLFFFVLPPYRLHLGDWDFSGNEQETKAHDLDNGALFGSILKRQVIRAANGVATAQEVYGNGIDEKAGTPTTGGVERGQKADSDALAKKLAEMED